MKKFCVLNVTSILLGVFVLSCLCLAAEQSDRKKVVFEINKKNLKYVQSSEESSFVLSKNNSIILNASKKEDWPGVTFTAPQGSWDLST